MGFTLQNFCWGLLEEEVMDNVTSILLEDITRFPVTMSPANPLVLTISDGRQDPEIVYCTGIVADTLEVLRGQEGTVPKVWPAGSKIWAMLTAAVIQDFGAVEANQVSVVPVGNLVSTDVQSALAELDSDLSGVIASLGNYQPLDPMLTALSALVTLADKGLYFTGPDVPAQYDLSAFARTILDDADAAAVRATLVLGALAVLNTVATGVIDDDAVTLAKLANIATASFLGRSTAGTGDPEVLTVAQAKTLLDLAGINSGDQTITLTGNVTGSGTGSFATTIANDVVTNAKLANMTQQTIKGRAVGAGTGDPTDLTSAQATAILDAFTTSLKGLAPASGGGTTNFLRADGTWAAPGGGAVQRFYLETSTPVALASLIIPADNTTPLPTEGAQIFSQAVTPTDASNKICFHISVQLGLNTASSAPTVTLFRGGTCIAVFVHDNASSANDMVVGYFEEVAASTSSRTYSIRYGSGAGTIALCDDGGSGGNYSSTLVTTMLITEEKP